MTPPDPGDVHTPADLGRRLEELYDAAGRPSEAQISGDVRSIISEATARQIVRHNVAGAQRDEVVAFAAALGGAAPAWRAAYDRAFPAGPGDPRPSVTPVATKLRWAALGAVGALVLSFAVVLAVPKGRDAVGLGPAPTVSTDVSAGATAVPASPVPASTPPAPRPAGPEPWHADVVTGTAKNPDTVTIDPKHDGTRVAKASVLTGVSAALCCGRTLWVLVHPQGDPRAYPDQACTSAGPEGVFSCTNLSVGEPADEPGLWYSVVVVVLEPGEAPKFTRADDNGGFPFGTLPGRVRSVSNTIWIQRA